MMKRLKKRICKLCYVERYNNPAGAKLIEMSWESGRTICVVKAKDELAIDRTVLFFEHHEITQPPPEWCPYYLEQIL